MGTNFDYIDYTAEGGLYVQAAPLGSGLFEVRLAPSGGYGTGSVEYYAAVNAEVKDAAGRMHSWSISIALQGRDGPRAQLTQRMK